jgi:hypothetical protein
MARISEQDLTTAFIAFRDSLPEDHGRRIRLASVNRIRYDTVDPSIVHLISDETTEGYRRLPVEGDVNQVASTICLFQAHIFERFDLKEEFAYMRPMLLSLSDEIKSSYGIYDVFITDATESHIVILRKDMYYDTPVSEQLMMHFLNQTDSYGAMFHEIFSYIRKMKGKEINMPTYMTWKVIFMTTDPKFKEYLNKRLAGMIGEEDPNFCLEDFLVYQPTDPMSPQLKKRFDAYSTRLVGQLMASVFNSISPGLCDVNTGIYQATRL